MPGSHRNVRRRSDKVVIYWQAWRGGPHIGRFEGASMPEALRAEANGAESLARRYAEVRQVGTPKDMIVGLVHAYKTAPDGFQKLSRSTQQAWGSWLDEIVDHFGSLPTVGLKSKGVRRQIIEWRNGFADTPRKADYGMQVLRRVLSWSVQNELAEANPALGIPDLYRNDRSAEVVEQGELAAILTKATPPVSRFIRLAAATGLRRGDLSRLRWTDISETSIELATGKSRGRKRIIVPLLPEARTVLAECREAQQAFEAAAVAAGKAPVASMFVLTTHLGGPWSKDGPTGGWIRAAKACEPPVQKHLHDLRGTFATLLMGRGLSDEQIADVMGWESKDVAKIRRRYVDRDLIAQQIADRLAQGR